MIDLFGDSLFWTGLVLIFGLDLALSGDTATTIRHGVAHLPDDEQARARRWAFGLAGLLRLVLLLGVLWLLDIGRTAFALPFWSPGWGQLVLAAGGIFLIYRAVSEMAALFEGGAQPEPGSGDRGMLLRILELGAIGTLLSVDSVFLATAIGTHMVAMAIGLTASLFVLFIASDAIEDLMNRHKSLRMLVLAALFLTGAVLLGEGLGQAAGKMPVHVAIGVGAVVWGLTTLTLRAPKPMPVIEPEIPFVAERTEPVLDEPVAAPVEPVIDPIPEPQGEAVVDPFVENSDDEALGEPAPVVQKSGSKSEPRKRGTARRKTSRRSASSEQG